MTKKRAEKIAVFAILIVITAVLTFKDKLISIAKSLPECYIRRSTGLLCPACGNTRSVLALLKFDIAEALSYNIIPPIVLALCIAAYVQLIFSAFDIRVHILPRSSIFYILLSVVMSAYVLLRNFLPFLTVANLH